MTEFSENVGRAAWDAVKALALANGKVSFSEVGRAAIEAMREPTEVMLKVYAANDIAEKLSTYDESNAVVWKAMIDAALK